MSTGVEVGGRKGPSAPTLTPPETAETGQNAREPLESVGKPTPRPLTVRALRRLVHTTRVAEVTPWGEEVGESFGGTIGRETGGGREGERSWSQGGVLTNTGRGHVGDRPFYHP